MTTVGDRIMEALGLFERYGWCRGHLQNPQGQVCAVGAVNCATSGHPLGVSSRYRPELEALAAHIPADFDFNEPYFPFPLTPWDKCALYNNSRTSFDEVRSWFEKTALDEGVTLS